MTTPVTPVTPDEVRRIAQLARLGLPAGRVEALVGELNGILAHMAELSTVDTEGVEGVEGVGAAGAPLEQDHGPPIPLARTPDAFAPSFRDGFFLVPRLASHGEGGPG
ncbi:MAG TPA: Asp-tRNA(Asn)/Glu-tRNA(Gln) amidotransferase subunit GatC [Gemmatimonadaceae bacterium]